MLKTLSIKAESYVKIYIFRVWQWTHLARPRWQHSLWRLQGPREEYEDKVQNLLLLLHNNRKNVYWCLGGKEWHMLGKEHWGLSAQFWGLHLWCNLWMWRRSRFWSRWLNIARGTTDPEIDSVTWTKFSDHKAWSTDGETCISYKFSHQMAPLSLVPNVTTRWRNFHWLVGGNVKAY